MNNVKEKVEDVKVEKTIDIESQEEYIEDNTKEKKNIIYLIIIFLILSYIAIFFIHDIVDKGNGADSSTSIVPNPDIVVDNSARFKIKQGEVEFNELKELDIFKNKYFEDRSIIAPGVHGDYSFTVENESESVFRYNIAFAEENPYKINMVFKLKVNGEYVVGNEKNWVQGGNFFRTELILNAKSKDIYTVEWKWEDTDHDTEIGEQGGPGGAYYKMNVKAMAEQVIE